MRQILVFHYAYSKNGCMYETKIFKVFSKWVGLLVGVRFQE